MLKLKATWSIDLKALDLKAMEHTNRGYHMDIEPGGLYEVWLPFDEHPKPAIAICHIPDHLDHIEIWDVVVDGRLITQRAGRIFRTGTAKPPAGSMEEIMLAMKEEIQHTEDQKILKLLSEMT